MARLEQYYEDFAVKSYLADAAYLQGQNKAFTVRLTDILNPSKDEEKPAEEIAADIIERAGLKFE